MALELHNLKIEDMEMVMNWRMLPEVTEYMFSDPVLSIESQREWYYSTQSNPNVKYWMIVMDNTKIGVLNLSNMDYKNRRTYWGYYIADMSFRGRGIATLLECNVYDYVFENLKFHKLCGEVLDFNDKVVSIHQKFGSEIEGKLKDHIYKNGKYHDLIVMGITEDKWRQIRDSYTYEKIYME